MTFARKYPLFLIMLILFCPCLILAQKVSGNEIILNKDLNQDSVRIKWDFYKNQPLQHVFELRHGLELAKMNADEVLFNDFNAQLKTVVFDLNNIEELKLYVIKAEMLIYAKYFCTSEQEILFSAMGDAMLTKVSDTLQTSINAGIFDVYNPDIEYILKRLMDDKVNIKYKVDNFGKTLRYLWKGDFRYVYHKLTTTYKQVFAVFLFGLIILFIVIVFRKQIFKLLKPNK